MVRVVVHTDRRGLLRSVHTSGHAGAGRRGEDVVCAAVASLVRSAARVLEADERFSVRGAAHARGELSFSVGSIPQGLEGYLLGVTNYLIAGVGDIASEYPDGCSLDIRKGAEYGT